MTPPAAGTFGGSATVTARLTAGAAPLAGATVLLGVGGSSRAAVTAADGTAAATIPLNGVPGATSVTASYAGDDTYAPAGADAPFSLAEAPKALAGFTPQLLLVFAPGATGISTALTASLGGSGGTTQPLMQRTVTFTLTGAASRTVVVATDYLGRAVLQADGLAAGASTYLPSTRSGGQLVVTLSRQQVLDAVKAELAAAGKRDHDDLRDTVEALTDSLTSSYWIDPLHPVMKRAGGRVFDADIDAVKAFGDRLRDKKSGVAPAKLQAWIDALGRSDRMIARLAIDEAAAANGNAKHLADAAKELANGDARVAAGRPAGGIQQCDEAWDDAKDSLVKPGKRSDRDHDRDRSHDDDTG